jgi:uncharacterized protein YecA (UPF0149 family)
MSKFTENAKKEKPANPLTQSWFLVKAIALLRKMRHEAPFKPSSVVPNAGLTRKELRRFAPDKYSPCACGSGAKFKFCCWSKEYQSI